jgi:cation-transporting ATPase E
MATAESSPNASLRAVATGAAAAVGSEPAPAVRESVPFSSARKWSGVGLDGRGDWLLGAPDVLLDGRGHADVLEKAESGAASGRRILLLARAPGGLRGEELPERIEPAALLVLREEVRHDAADTLAFFARQGVSVKVISGDHARTVGAVAARLGLEGGEAVDSRELGDDAALAEAVERATVLGRVTPQQKRAMVHALQARGHVVAMGGDGVNDVLALKDADIGVAMGSGSSAARGVAQLVLLDNSFAALPPVVGEGRRVIANVERVANLFLTKTVYATLLALAVGVASVPFPFFPRHLTVVSSLTIGMPAFFLALAPNARRAQPGFVGRVLRFAVPAGLVAAAATFAAYSIVRNHEAVNLTEARTTATMVLFSVGLWVLAILARPATLARRVLVLSMGSAFLAVLAVPQLREFFEFDVPSLWMSLSAVAVVVAAALLIDRGWRLSGWIPRRLPGRSFPA